MAKAIRWIGIWTLALAMIPVAAVAQLNLPNGKPFRIIEEEFGAVDDRLKLVEGTVQSIDEKIAQLFECVRVFDKDTEIGGMKGPHVVFSKCNVHVRSGLGATDGEEQEVPADSTNGLGNLVIGYNEGRCLTLDPLPPTDGLAVGADDFPKPCLQDSECGDTGICVFGDRMGSHNLIVGHQHEYPSFGGILGGRMNQTVGPQTSTTGGSHNEARMSFSSIHGGSHNTALGYGAAVLGGVDNMATGDYSAAVGGGGNEAMGTGSAVVSGGGNDAVGTNSVVVGGGGPIRFDGTEFGTPAPNRSVGAYSAILGGQFNITGTNDTLVDGYAAAVCGGFNNNASGITAAIGGGSLNMATGDASSVGGGNLQTAAGSAEFKP